MFTAITKSRNEASRQRFMELFLHRAREIMANRTKLYDDVPDVTHRLRIQGIRLGIVSTKIRQTIHRILEREGLLDRFEVIIGESFR